MDLYLSEEEEQHLFKVARKYSYAMDLLNRLTPGNSYNHFIIHEADVWEWKEVVDSEKCFLPLIQGSLKKKLTDLYERVS